MTRKDFVLGTEVYADFVQQEKFSKYSATAIAMRNILVRLFSRGNPRFDAQKFYQDCANIHFRTTGEL